MATHYTCHRSSELEISGRHARIVSPVDGTRDAHFAWLVEGLDMSMLG